MRFNAVRGFPSLLCLIVLSTANLNAAVDITSILYAGLGGHNNGDSTNDGALAIVDQTTGAVTIVGHPAGVSRISGLNFDLSGALFASTQAPGGFPPPPGASGGSRLLQLNPTDGSILNNVAITDGVNNISIADLAGQPVTGVLYGIRAPGDQLGGQGKLYTINKSTGLATLVGNTGHFFGAIAFAPNGTFYMVSGDLSPSGNIINQSLLTLNPSNAATLTSVPIPLAAAMGVTLGALGVRPDDGVIFAGDGDSSQLFTLNPANGALALVGNTGTNFIGDLAFQTPLTVGPGQCVPLTVNLPVPAGPNGEIVTFSSSNLNVAFVNLDGFPNLLIPPGATTDRRTPTVCGVNFGTATINETINGGALLVSQPVLVTAGLIFYPASVTVPIGFQARPTLLLSSPAPGNLTINLTSGNPGIASVPATVTIPAGFTSVTVPVTGVAAGSTTIHASGMNVGTATLPVTVH